MPEHMKFPVFSTFLVPSDGSHVHGWPDHASGSSQDFVVFLLKL